MKRGLLRFVLQRVAQAIPLLIGIVVLNFTLISIAPGDPVTILAGERADPDYIAHLRADLGLDKPIPQRLMAYFLSIVKGDLGVSLTFRRPVLVVLGERVPVTLLLMGVQFVLAIAFGVVLGTFAALHPHTKVDYAVTGLSVVGFSMPIFWLGQILILLFAMHLQWLPVQGYQSLRGDSAGWIRVVDVGRHLVLPALTLTLVNLAVFARLYRASLLNVIGSDYVRTARAKGLTPKRVYMRHAFRNALLPLVTMIGLRFGYILSGSVITETVFAWPGIGRLLYDSVFARDYPMLMGIFLLTSVMVILGNLLADIAYALVDPRVRLT